MVLFVLKRSISKIIHALSDWKTALWETSFAPVFRLLC